MDIKQKISQNTWKTKLAPNRILFLFCEIHRKFLYWYPWRGHDFKGVTENKL